MLRREGTQVIYAKHLTLIQSEMMRRKLTLLMKEGLQRPGELGHLRLFDWGPALGISETKWCCCPSKEAEMNLPLIISLLNLIYQVCAAERQWEVCV